MAELATMKKELQAEHEQTRNERDRLLEFLGYRSVSSDQRNFDVTIAARRDVTIAAG